MENADRTFADNQNKIARLEGELSSAMVAASEFERKIKAMKSTASWRFTAPLREARRSSLRLMSSASSIKVALFWDRQAWRLFFRNAEKKFRLTRRALWKRKAKLPPSRFELVRPKSERGVAIQKDLHSAIRRYRDAA